LIPSRRFLFFLKKTCQRTFVWMPNPSAQALIFSKLFKKQRLQKKSSTESPEAGAVVTLR